ncbi:MAG: glycosyl hydrolase family 18 protein [Terriglobia bacterium]
MNKTRASQFFFLAREAPTSLWPVAVLIALLVSSLPSSGREPQILSQFYLVNDPASFQSLKDNYGKISLVCPQWFSTDETGTLESSVDSTVVDWAAEKHVLLMPLLTNKKFLGPVAHAVLNNDSIQGRLIQGILEAAQANHFFGIQWDFENIPAEDRDLYSKFIRRVSKEFRWHHLKLSVAVVPPLAPPPATSPLAPPPTSGWITNPQSVAFDYHSLAADVFFVSLMTYDEYASPEQPGPVAGKPWIEACLRETLESVSHKKLLLGIPLYYREWSGKSIHEGSSDEAQDLAAKWKTKITLDPVQSESYFSFKDDGQQHFVWLQDQQTLRARLAMVDRYQLAGFSAWRLGFENSKAWENTFPKVIKKIH